VEQALLERHGADPAAEAMRTHLENVSDNLLGRH
jgi:hypothetical protein